jgi:hypothetical protein
MRATPNTLLISIPIGLAFQLYLFLAMISIPPAAPAAGHYNFGNELVAAVFYSYMPFTWMLSLYVGAIMYGAYAYVALARLRRAGLILFALHYGFAALVAVPVYLERSPGLLEATRQQLSLLADRPGTMLLCFAPFVIANLWYLARLLRNHE